MVQCLRPATWTHEHVVGVVVGSESLRGRRSEVGVDLNGVTQVRNKLAGELDQRRPGAVQALEDHGRTIGVCLGDGVRVDLIGDRRADAPCRG